LKYVLVTGGSGYVGSHVSKMLFENGYTPVVFDLMADFKDWASPHWPAVSGDINNNKDLIRIFNLYNFDAVIHLAASSEVGASVTDPLRYYKNNVGGTANILQFCAHMGINKVVFSSTSSVYGEVNPDKLPTCEYYPKNPITSYGSSKWAVECMLRDVDVAHNIRSVSLRYFNASGASPDSKIGEFRPKPSHLIPSIQAVVEGHRPEFVVNGDDYATADGTTVRDYTHIWDIAQAHLCALKYLDQGGITDCFNIGAGKGKSVLEVFNEFQSQLGKPIAMRIGEKRPGDIPINYADTSKAQGILKWQPVMSDTVSIVRDAINWYNSELYQKISHYRD
jgi:UDP-glucose-4-epimerase GalE